MDEKRYQVFVSSTYKDLTDERAAVIQAILGLDHFPAGMELFPAANDDQWTLIKQVIAQSDYYVVVVAGRYGSLSAEGISYTEMEYDYAVTIGVPILGFVHGEPEKIESGKTEASAKAKKKLAEFRAKVETRMVKHFTNADQLGGLVTTSLVREMKTNPRTGWVRGDKAMTPETELEILTLRAELAESREKSQSLIHESARGSNHLPLAEGDDRVQARILVYSNSYSVDTNVWVTTNISWNAILEAIGPALIDEETERETRAKLANRFFRGRMSKEDRDVVTQIPNRALVLADADFDKIMVHLRSLGLIESGVKRRPVNNLNKYLHLTALGQQQLAELVAVTKDNEQPELSGTRGETAAKEAPAKAPTKKAAAKKAPAKKVPAKKSAK